MRKKVYITFQHNMPALKEMVSDVTSQHVLRLQQSRKNPEEIRFWKSSNLESPTKVGATWTSDDQLVPSPFVMPCNYYCSVFLRNINVKLVNVFLYNINIKLKLEKNLIGPRSHNPILLG